VTAGWPRINPRSRWWSLQCSPGPLDVFKRDRRRGNKGKRYSEGEGGKGMGGEERLTDPHLEQGH